MCIVLNATLNCSDPERNCGPSSLDTRIGPTHSAPFNSPKAINPATAAIISFGTTLTTIANPCPLVESIRQPMSAATSGAATGTSQSFQMLRSMIQNHTTPEHVLVCRRWNVPAEGELLDGNVRMVRRPGAGFPLRKSRQRDSDASTSRTLPKGWPRRSDVARSSRKEA